MNSLEYLNEGKEIDPDRNRSDTIIELTSKKTIKVRPNTYERLLNLKEKLYQQTKGKIISFDFVLNFLVDQSRLIK